jgi:hypothetical protein
MSLSLSNTGGMRTDEPTLNDSLHTYIIIRDDMQMSIQLLSITIMIG